MTPELKELHDLGIDFKEGEPGTAHIFQHDKEVGTWSMRYGLTWRQYGVQQNFTEAQIAYLCESCAFYVGVRLQQARKEANGERTQAQILQELRERGVELVPDEPTVVRVFHHNKPIARFTITTGMQWHDVKARELFTERELRDITIQSARRVINKAAKLQEETAGREQQLLEAEDKLPWYATL